jgi:single-strand DNA-binding protein
VIVSGRLKQRTYETKEGEKRTVFEVEVDEIGPSLRYATTKVQKMSRSSGGGFGGGGGSAPADDPWASATPASSTAPAGASAAAGSSGGFNDEPPF